LDADAALDVLQEARSRGLAVHINSPNPVPAADLRRIVQWQRQYDLGRAVAARTETWCSYREKADGSWYDDPGQCPAAPIFRLGIYPINDLVPLFPAPESVHVTHSRIFTGRPTPDNALLVIRFAGGEIASVFASFCVKDGCAYRQTTTVNFESGTVVRRNSVAEDGRDVTLRLFRAPAHEFDPVRTDPLLETATCPAAASSGMYLWDAFARAVRGEKLEDELDPEHVVAGIRIVEAMAKAQHTGQAEPVV
jgi:predicted dehydrogenase